MTDSIQEMSNEHKPVVVLVADLLSELGEHALKDSVKAVTQRASYLEDKVSEQEAELDSARIKYNLLFAATKNKQNKKDKALEFYADEKTYQTELDETVKP